jgi:hypothetical protein
LSHEQVAFNAAGFYTKYTNSTVTCSKFQNKHKELKKI